MPQAENSGPQVRRAAAAAFPGELITEIEQFRMLCQRRYRFNSFWDNVLNVFAICVSLGIVAAGVYRKSGISALLGGLITALVAAQRAFPFNQRWQFYRLLDSQAANLLTEAVHGVVTIDKAIVTLKAMRLEFALQVPRGHSFQSDRDSQAGAKSAGSVLGNADQQGR